MKHTCIFLLFFTFATALSAQIQKGAVLIGGTVGFNNVSVDGFSRTTINISPMAGFLLTNRFMLGGSVGLSLVTGDGSDQGVFSVIPFARYYLNGSGSARFFGQVNIGSQTDFSDGENNSVFVYGLGLGADFFLNDRVAIEGLLGYLRLSDSDGFGVNNIGLNFGVAAFIGRGKE